jgi:steroid 5-alpha reductase family enzyme
MTPLLKGWLILLVAYPIAAFAGWIAAGFFAEDHLVLQMAGFCFVSASVIFCFSLAFSNSSLFDPYWSVAPVVIFFYLLWHQPDHWFHAGQAGNMLPGRWFGFPRIFFVLVLVCWWGVRLTWNFLRMWTGGEDWRYLEIRAKTGKAYWPVSFLGIHLFPAFMIFLGSLSLWPVLSGGIRQAGITDLAALLVTGFAIGLETKADRQLYNHVKNSSGTGKTLDTGLWAVSRHPNYLGEITFWWGLYLFALAADPGSWWVVAGPVAITMMFLFISIPMMEHRMLKRKVDYNAYMEKTGKIISFQIRKRS